MSYKIYKDGTTYVAESDGISTTVDFTSTTSLDDLLNNQLFPNAPINGCTFDFTRSPQIFILNNPIVIPNSSSGITKHFTFKFIPTSSRDFGGTIFKASSSFPTNRYFIENVSTAGSGKITSMHLLDGPFFYNPYPDLGVGSGTELNIGGVKFEGDMYYPKSFVARGTMGNYIWRGIHVIGMVQYWSIQDTYFFDVNTNFRGDCDYIFELRDRDQVGGSDHSAGPELGYGANMKAGHIAGDSGGNGYMNNFFFHNGKYNVFHDLKVDGMKYKDSVYRFNKSWSNRVYGLWAIDLNTVDSNTIASLVLDNVDNSDLTKQTFHNIFYDVDLATYSGKPTIKYLNGALRNTIYLSQFGSPIVLDDAGASTDKTNVVFVNEGQIVSGGTVSAITTTNGNVTISDLRQKATQKGTGTIAINTMSVTITHNLITTPQKIRIFPTSTKFMDWYISARDSTTFTVSLTRPTLSTITFDWEATING